MSRDDCAPVCACLCHADVEDPGWHLPTCAWSDLGYEPGSASPPSPIDLLNDALAEAEEALHELRLGVTVRVALGEQSLAYMKRGPTWGLFIEYASGDARPILSASKGHRIEAAFKLWELYEELRLSAEEEVGRALEAIEAAEAFVARVREDSGVAAERTDQ